MRCCLPARIRPTKNTLRCCAPPGSRAAQACGKCWREASGGVPDGDAAHPYYRYGGLWRNLHAAPQAGTSGSGSSSGARQAEDQGAAAAAAAVAADESDAVT